MVYPLLYDLVAQTDNERARAKRLILNITRYITQNGYYLIDVTGKPTTWCEFLAVLVSSQWPTLFAWCDGVV